MGRLKLKLLKGNINSNQRCKNSKLRPSAPPSSFLGTARSSWNSNPCLTDSQRWIRRKQESNQLERPTFDNQEWDQEWANGTAPIPATTDPSSRTAQQPLSGSTFPLLQSRKNLPLVQRHRLPHPPSLPPSALQKIPSVWMPSGRRRVPKKQQPQTSHGPTFVQRGWTPSDGNEEDGATGGYPADATNSKEHYLQFGPPLPLHVVITETAAVQVKRMERVKNKLRAIFIEIDKATLKVKDLREKLGVKKDPTAMTTQQRISLQKFQSKLEKNTKGSNTITKSNEEIRRNINDQRLMVQNTKRGLIINSKRLNDLKTSMESMLSNQILIANEKLERKIGKIMMKEEKANRKVENEILRLSERLFQAKRILKLNMPTMNASPRSSVRDYQQAAVQAAAMAATAANTTRGHLDHSAEEEEEEEFSFRMETAAGASSHRKAENLLKDAETKIRQKLSPIAIQKLGAFARYAHEEETGAFTTADKRQILSKTARMNWKIAFALYRKRKDEQIEHMYQLSWKRILHANPHLSSIREFVTDFLTHERRTKSITERITKNNKAMNLIQMNNALMTTKLNKFKTTHNEITAKKGNELDSWKNEILLSKMNSKKYAQQRIHTHEIIKLVMVPCEKLMKIMQTYDPTGCERITRMNHLMGGSGGDHQIHRTIGFVESSVDSMLLVKAKNQQDQRNANSSRSVGSNSSSRTFSTAGVYHNGSKKAGSHRGNGVLKGHGKSRKGSVTCAEWGIDHLLPTSFNEHHNHHHEQQPHEHLNGTSIPVSPVSVSHHKSVDVVVKVEHSTAVIEHAPKVRQHSTGEGANHETEVYIQDWRKKHQDKFQDQFNLLH